MRPQLSLPRVLFALACAGIALFSLAYGDFAPGGMVLPGWLPERHALVLAVAILVLVGSAALILPRSATVGALLLIAYFLIWMLLGLPGVFTLPPTFGGWYGFCEGMSCFTGACLLLLPPGSRNERVAQVLFGLTCIFYGASHFAFADYTAVMVPSWLPGRLPLAYLTGLFHALAGIGMVVGVLPRLAATLEALMMSLFGLLVWLPTFFMHPPPTWATPPKNQWSELAVNGVLAGAAWLVASSLRSQSWGPASRRG